MSNTSFRNFNSSLDRMDFEVIFQQINLNTALTLTPIEVSAILCEPCSRKIEIFSAKPNFSSLIRGGVYVASSNFGRLGQNPVGAINSSFNFPKVSAYKGSSIAKT